MTIPLGLTIIIVALAYLLGVVMGVAYKSRKIRWYEYQISLIFGAWVRADAETQSRYVNGLFEMWKKNDPRWLKIWDLNMDIVRAKLREAKR